MACRFDAVDSWASVCVSVGGKWSGAGEKRLAEWSRSATTLPSRRRKPVAHAVNVESFARDERAWSEAERAWARRETGDRPMARYAERRARWSWRLGVGSQMLKNGCPISRRERERARCVCVASGRVVQTASVCGRRAEVERRRSGAPSEAESERNGTAEPQTEANACAVNR